jgi:hypothetical protein
VVAPHTEAVRSAAISNSSFFSEQDDSKKMRKTSKELANVFIQKNRNGDEDSSGIKSQVMIILAISCL